MLFIEIDTFSEIITKVDRVHEKSNNNLSYLNLATSSNFETVKDIKFDSTEPIKTQRSHSIASNRLNKLRSPINTSSVIEHRESVVKIAFDALGSIIQG